MSAADDADAFVDYVAIGLSDAHDKEFGAVLFPLDDLREYADCAMAMRMPWDFRAKLCPPTLRCQGLAEWVRAVAFNDQGDLFAPFVPGIANFEIHFPNAMTEAHRLGISYRPDPYSQAGDRGPAEAIEPVPALLGAAEHLHPTRLTPPQPTFSAHARADAWSESSQFIGVLRHQRNAAELHAICSALAARHLRRQRDLSVGGPYQEIISKITARTPALGRAIADGEHRLHEMRIQQSLRNSGLPKQAPEAPGLGL